MRPLSPNVDSKNSSGLFPNILIKPDNTEIQIIKSIIKWKKRCQFEAVSQTGRVCPFGC